MKRLEDSIRGPESGANQSGLRDLNARVVLSFVRRNGGLPSAEIARRSGLSAQTVSNIIRALEAEGLLLRGKGIKGKVGKPSVPVDLNPEGVNSLGLSIGRRSAELVLVDFRGARMEACKTSYPYPVIEDVFAFLERGIEQLFSKHPQARQRVVGIGVARPNNLWDWLELVNAPEDAMRKWQDLELAEEIKRTTGFDVFIENDATSACVAEQLLGRGREFSDFAYVFVGAFVGGGLVLNGKVVSGRTMFAAALGPLPVPDGQGGTTQLLNVASLLGLEHAFEDAGLDPDRLRQNTEDWSDFDGLVEPWIETTGQNLAIASAAIASVVEVEAVLIDGAMPRDVRERLVAVTQQKYREQDTKGIQDLQIGEAAIGNKARSLGAALLPIHSRYFLT